MPKAKEEKVASANVPPCNSHMRLSGTIARSADSTTPELNNPIVCCQQKERLQIPKDRRRQWHAKRRNGNKLTRSFASSYLF
jgi:hypothetical protein